ncbi:MAG: agmatine deiminase family protein [Mariniphaga sp.]
MNKKNIIFPAEWSDQSGVLLTWPHKGSDWVDMLEEVEECFISLAQAISKREKVLIVCPDSHILTKKLVGCNFENIIFSELPSNDTWARDHGAITVVCNDKLTLYDFTFNGWGMKFASNFDNQITYSLYEQGVFSQEVQYENMQNLVLEGGSIESDGEGIILTTRECLFSKNRNQYLSEKQIEQRLTELFNLKKILWLSSGYLAGDDTDSHIDTLARFCDPETIAYVKCDDPADEHFDALRRMEDELFSFKTLNNKPYKLIALPMADAAYDGMLRLPATYANFLIINGAVLVPFYNSPKDKLAELQLQKAFPDREIIGIDCRPLIRQNGSLHCVTMQFPKGVI